MKKRIYLDYAAATPVDEAVLTAMLPYMRERFYNPSAPYLAAADTARAVAEARATVAQALGARPSEIIFTSGATEANNLAIHGVLRRFPEGNAVVSAFEHQSVLAPARRYDCREVAVDEDGLLAPDKLAAAIDDRTVLVSVIYANNEIGTVQHIRQLTEIVRVERDRRVATGEQRPIYMHTDAAQAANYLDLHVSRLSVDMMSLNGAKIYGPKGTGALYVRTGVELLPLQDGGGQEMGRRSGTENVPAIVGLAKALQIAVDMRRDEIRRLKPLQQMFVSKIHQVFPDAVLNGSLRYRLPNNVHLTFPGKDNERLMMALEERGVLCAAGSACSASKAESSHVLRAIGRNDREARASLRFTMGRETDEAAVEASVAALFEIMR